MTSKLSNFVLSYSMQGNTKRFSICSTSSFLHQQPIKSNKNKFWWLCVAYLQGYIWRTDQKLFSTANSTTPNIWRVSKVEITLLLKFWEKRHCCPMLGSHTITWQVMKCIFKIGKFTLQRLFKTSSSVITLIIKITFSTIALGRFIYYCMTTITPTVLLWRHARVIEGHGRHFASCLVSTCARESFKRQTF